MPAQRKYLSSPIQRSLKISAAILGGYIVSAAFHLMLSVISSGRETTIIISSITIFIVWIALMIYSFLSKNGYTVWLIYIFLTLIFTTIACFLK